jgi:hypothetical protein
MQLSLFRLNHGHPRIQSYPMGDRRMRPLWFCDRWEPQPEQVQLRTGSSPRDFLVGEGGQTMRKAVYHAMLLSSYS